MTTIEEILIRMGFIDQASPGIENVKRQAEGMGKETGKWYQHAAKEGKAFHKVLEEITAQSPLLGNALKLAINPIAGTMVAAASAFAYVEKQIEELNQKLDKMESVSRAPMSNLATATAAATHEIAKLNAELDRYHKQANLEGKRAEREDAARNEAEANKTQLAIDEDRASKRKAQEEAQLKSKLSGNALVMAQYELEKKYAKEVHDLRVNAAKKQLDASANAKQAASDEFKKAKDNLELWKGLATNKGQKDLAAQIDKNKQENVSAEKRLSGYEQIDEVLRKKREGVLDEGGMAKALGNIGLVSGLPTNTLATIIQGLREGRATEQENANAQNIIKERGDILRRNKEIAEEELRLAATNEELKRAQERFKSAGDELRKFENEVQGAKRELGKLQQTPPQVLKPLANEAGWSNSFLSTVHELAMSGQWVQNRAFGGRPISRPFWQSGPFAGIARGIELDEMNAHAANDWGDFQARDFFKNRARKMRDELGTTGALKSEEFLDTIAKSTESMAKQAAGPGLNVNPANGQ